MKEIVDILHNGLYSCVIRNGIVRTFERRGVIDIYELIKNEPAFLRGADVADKVVGKGAATLMSLGGVKRLHTNVISESALAVLQKGKVEVEYITKVENIINREGTGICPVEKLLNGVDSLEDSLIIISDFIKKMQSK